MIPRSHYNDSNEDRVNPNRFTPASETLILNAQTVTLEPYSTSNGYYLYVNDQLFCTIAHPEKLQHLFDLLTRRVSL